ncbi:hypothetical protein RRG08_035625 [Elysia crispata]|uniref:Uncharacterized protein n=1 Tax=Elysia crispata TaxID=231223 RepID=A0AAE1DQJ3_9GAST|nr:hypothetical protein RRG08_035625 [Elysia crispata]
MAHQHKGNVIPQTLSDNDSDSSVTNPFHSDNDESYIPDSCDDDDDDRDEASFFPSQAAPALLEDEVSQEVPEQNSNKPISVSTVPTVRRATPAFF